VPPPKCKVDKHLKSVPPASMISETVLNKMMQIKFAFLGCAPYPSCMYGGRIVHVQGIWVTSCGDGEWQPLCHRVWNMLLHKKLTKRTKARHTVHVLGNG
jgi:hypothetical protein